MVYNGVLLSHQKEWSLAICNDADGVRVYYAKWSKSVRERQIQWFNSYIEVKKQNRWTLGKGKKRERQTIRDS